MMRWKHYVVCRELKKKFDYTYENLKRSLKDEVKWNNLTKDGKIFLSFLLNPVNTTLEYKVLKNVENLEEIRENADLLIYRIHTQLKADYKQPDEKASRF